MRILILLLFFPCIAYFAGRPETGKATPTETGTVFRSLDGGKTWQDISAGLPADLRVSRVFSSRGEVLLASENGLYRSRDLTTIPKWRKDLSLYIDIAGIFPGEQGPYAYNYENGLLQEVPGTGIWVPKYHDLKGKMVLSFLEAPGGNFFIGCDNGIYKSDDKGKSWKKVFAESWITHLIAADGAIIGCGDRGLLRSTDNGAHWNWTLTGAGTAMRTSLLGEQIGAITSGAGSTSKSISNCLLMSSDNGKTWSRMDEGLPPIRRIYDIEQAGQYLFCSLNAGIFRSADNGKTWKLVRPVKSEWRFELVATGDIIFAVMVPDIDEC